MDDIYTVDDVPPALVPLADLERERLWRANAQADLHELEQKYNALVAACRAIFDPAVKHHWRISSPEAANRFYQLQQHLPEPT